MPKNNPYWIIKTKTRETFAGFLCSVLQFRIMAYMRIIAFLILILAVVSCKPSGQPRSRGASDIENAIRIIESRKVAEQGIIDAHEYEIEVLKGNLEKVSSDGMRKKLSSEIEMKILGIQKARRNISNQDTILQQLRLKSDSIKALSE